MTGGSLKVQRDDLARVVRVLDGEGFTELPPEDAKAIGEELLRAGRELETEQSTLDDAPGQTTLDDEKSTGETLHDMVDRVETDGDRQRPEPGVVLNRNDPLKW